MGKRVKRAPAGGRAKKPTAKRAANVRLTGKKKRSAKPSASRAPAAPPRPSPRRLVMFHVDAFTNRPFHGNPAGVVVLDRWLDRQVMQTIASENNLAETAFIAPVPHADGTARFGIRWFSPMVEIDLCGHATIACAHVLWEHLRLKGSKIVFESMSGLLPVRRDSGGWIELDFPARPGEPVNEADRLARILGREPVEVYKSRDYLAVFDSRRDISEIDPDFDALRELDCLGVIATAPGVGHDYVIRFFAPRAGVNEDPATGSAHCTLVPYWSRRLGRRTLSCRQMSKRGGEFKCEDRGDRVAIAGRAVTYLQGTISV